MGHTPRGVILVGHGGIPKDYPHELVQKLKRLEAKRRASGDPPSAEELELGADIRNWPRKPENDPYKTGLEALGQQLKTRLKGVYFGLAYNEFCGPTLEEAIRAMVVSGVLEVTVVSSMFTPGGSHSEIEIPEIIERMKKEHPHVTLQYAWPFNLGMVAAMLVDHLSHYSHQRL